jgi:hypothetical protein
VLGKPGRPDEAAEGSPGSRPAVTCSCGSGVPVSWLEVAGRQVEVKALPVLMLRLRDSGRPADEASARELLDQVRVYNEVAEGTDGPWLEALHRAYAAFCAREEGGQ